MKIIPVILAGGRGERFWPLSTPENPKQCLPLVSNEPMLMDTYNRLSEFDEFFIVANSFLCDKFREFLPEDASYIEEPYAKNTASAIGLACISLMEKFGDCIVFFETADHYYKDPNHYIRDIKKACAFAEIHDKIVLVGIKPDNPHTGYGYIKNGSLVEGSSDFFFVDSFKEKPDLTTAQGYLRDDSFSWNSGMFIAKCSVLLNEIKRYLPPLFAGLEKIKSSGFTSEVLDDEFRGFEKISIDYGIMEHSQETVVLSSTMHWDDIGDFNAIARILKPNSSGNFSKGQVQSINASGNIVVSEKLVALIGVDDLIIVDAPDALLVCKRSDSQKIKDLIRNFDNKNK